MKAAPTALKDRDVSCVDRAAPLALSAEAENAFDPSCADCSVSVIVPAYNGAEWIAETLDSILKQTVRPAEVIVVNDGSTDGTSAAVRSFGNSVTLIETPNQGVCRARNLGAKTASSNWLAFCDQDDIWLPDKLEKQLRIAQQSPEIRCVITDHAACTDGVINSRSHFSYAPPNFWNLDPDPAGFVVRQPIAGRMASFQPSITSVLLVQRHFFLSFGGFDIAAQRWSTEDTCVHFRCLSVVPFGVVPQVLMLYRKHPKAGSADSLKQLRNTIHVWKHMIARYPEAKPWKRDLLSGVRLLRKDLRESVRHQRRQRIKKMLARLGLWPVAADAPSDSPSSNR